MEQSRSIPLKKKRFLLRDSDRSGFTHRNVELFLDNGFYVAGDEYDSPPPSNRLYPGEGEVSPGDVRNNWTSYGVTSDQATLVQYLNTASTVSLSRLTDNAGQYTYNKSVVYVTGSNSDVILDSDPQISVSSHGDFLTVQCVGSSVTLINGSGLRLYSGNFKMDSGGMLNLIYNATDGLWCETSRINPDFGLTGAF